MAEACRPAATDPAAAGDHRGSAPPFPGSTRVLGDQGGARPSVPALLRLVLKAHRAAASSVVGGALPVSLPTVFFC